MKVLRNVTQKTKQMEETLFFKEEKVTVINGKKVVIQNYKDLISITDTEIILSNLKVIGRQLRLKLISKYFMEIEGIITGVQFGGGGSV